MKGDPEVLIPPALSSHLPFFKKLTKQEAGKTELYHPVIHIQEEVAGKRFALHVLLVLSTQTFTKLRMPIRTQFPFSPFPEFSCKI